MSGRISIVLSQAQSRHPEKRKLEEELVAELMGRPEFDLSLIPNLYDIHWEDSAFLTLEGISGPMVVLSWHYPRAAFWTLAQLGICGRFGKSRLHEETDEDEQDQDVGDSQGAAAAELPASEAVPAPSGKRPQNANRLIYCIDLRASSDVQAYLEELERIRREATTRLYPLQVISPSEDTSGSLEAKAEPKKEAPLKRRWYPVIDYSRCTHCMECIDFCLFGVYGVDAMERILVEQPDNCRKGCPACSRVCPENAIIFPQHKSPAIAGGAVGEAGLKIDLSQLFGAPTAQEIAARERDEQLMLAGRQPVGLSQKERDAAAAERNELDEMLDELDAMEL